MASHHEQDLSSGQIQGIVPSLCRLLEQFEGIVQMESVTFEPEGARSE